MSMKNAPTKIRAYCWMIVVVIIGIQNASEAQELAGQHRSVFETQYSCRANGKKSMLRTDDLTVLDFTIGMSSLRDVQKRFPGVHSVKLASEAEAEEGVCVKNEKGLAAVFATSVMGAPDTLVAIYLAPAALVESPRLTCTSVKLPSTAFSSQSGIRVGGTTIQLSGTLRGKVPMTGPFCIAYQIVSSKGPLQISKEGKMEGHDFTGVEGKARAGKIEWVKLFGIASD